MPANVRHSSAAILKIYRAYDEALGDLPHTVCYAVKANSSLAVLALLAKAGAGFDIVSGGEFVSCAGGGRRSGELGLLRVGKTADDVSYALENGIHTFSCQSEPELALVDALAARRGVTAGFAIRVNPDADVSTHPYISTGLREHKFGIDIADAGAVYERARIPQLEGGGSKLPHRFAIDGRQPDAGGARPRAGLGGPPRAGFGDRAYRPGRRAGCGLPGA